MASKSGLGPVLGRDEIRLATSREDLFPIPLLVVLAPWAAGVCSAFQRRRNRRRALLNAANNTLGALSALYGTDCFCAGPPSKSFVCRMCHALRPLTYEWHDDRKAHFLHHQHSFPLLHFPHSSPSLRCCRLWCRLFLCPFCSLLCRCLRSLSPVTHLSDCAPHFV